MLYLCLVTMIILWLAWQGRPAVAFAGALASAALVHAMWLEGPGRAPGPAWLELDGQGRFTLGYPGGRREAATLCRGSLFLGGGALLVLRGRRVYRFWLIRGHVNPATLAGLRRRLSQAAVRRPPRSRKFLYWLE